MLPHTQNNGTEVLPLLPTGFSYIKHTEDDFLVYSVAAQEILYNCKNKWSARSWWGLKKCLAQKSLCCSSWASSEINLYDVINFLASTAYRMFLLPWRTQVFTVVITRFPVGGGTVAVQRCCWGELDVCIPMPAPLYTPSKWVASIKEEQEEEERLWTTVLHIKWQFYPSLPLASLSLSAANPSISVLNFFHFSRSV